MFRSREPFCSSFTVNRLSCEMQSSAIERALRRTSDDNSPVNWGHVKRILNRQTSPGRLKYSLERIVEEPDLPMDTFIFAVGKVSSVDGLFTLFKACIQNIWRKVLVDREATAFGSFSPGPCHANREYVKELLSILSRKDMIQNQVFLNAFKKTKYLIQTIQQSDAQELPPGGSLVHALVVAQMPPFLILLAARDDPETLSKRDVSSGKLPLHMAMDANLSFARDVDYYRIRFSLAPGECNETSRHLLTLLNHQSPVPILCYFYPQAGCKADNPSSDRTECAPTEVGHIPLETFLYTLKDVKLFTACIGLSRNQNANKILKNIQEVIAIAPQVLDTPNLNNGLVPFMVPMLHWNLFQPNQRDGPYGNESAQNFLLTLTYTLLKENPMVLSHFLQSKNISLQPHTAYGKVLKGRIAQADSEIQTLQTKQAQWKRRIAELENENQELHVTRSLLQTFKKRIKARTDGKDE